MGWVRGQTGEQKRKEKQRPPGAGVWRDRGRDTLVGLRGRSPPGELHSPVGEGPDRSVTAARVGGPSRGTEGGGGAEPSSPGGGREKEGRGGRRGRPQGIPGPQCCTNEPTRPPGTRTLGRGESARRRKQPGRAGPRADALSRRPARWRTHLVRRGC